MRSSKQHRGVFLKAPWYYEADFDVWSSADKTRMHSHKIISVFLSHTTKNETKKTFYKIYFLCKTQLCKTLNSLLPRIIWFRLRFGKIVLFYNNVLYNYVSVRESCDNTYTYFRVDKVVIPNIE